MTPTVIKFIGLFVLTYLQSTTPPGPSYYRILMPQFTGMTTAHPSFIAYLATDRKSGQDDWPGAKDVPGMPGWQYVTVNHEDITFSGVIDGPPAQMTQGPPRLTCCCTPMTDGLQAAYLDPNTSVLAKKGAQVEVRNGSAATHTTGGGRVDTWVTMNTDPSSPDGITVSGQLGSGTGSNVKKLYFKPSAQVIFGNTPFCALQDPPPPGCGMDPDWIAYYTMSNTQNHCIATPATCADCQTSGSQSGWCSTSSCQLAPGTGKLTMRQRIAASKKLARTMNTINIECSNSQWP
jgi:hypothetical protein